MSAAKLHPAAMLAHHTRKRAHTHMHNCSSCTPHPELSLAVVLLAALGWPATANGLGSSWAPCVVFLATLLALGIRSTSGLGGTGAPTMTQAGRRLRSEKANSAQA